MFRLVSEAVRSETNCQFLRQIELYNNEQNGDPRLLFYKLEKQAC